MKRLLCLVMGFTLFLIGCAGDQETVEPVVDSQVLFQTSLDMEKWFVNVRFLKHMCTEASQAMSDRMMQRQYQDSDIAIEAMVNHFKKTNGLIDRLNEYLTNMRREEARLDAIKDKDARIYDNLKICNNLLERYIDLISSVPVTHQIFLDNRDDIHRQLSSIIRLLQIEYPLASEELESLTSMDNASYRSLIQQIRSAPLPAVDRHHEPEDIIDVPPPTPTVPPLITWRDADGFIHMGYDPPDEVEILRTQTLVSEPDEPIVSTPIPDEEPAEELPTLMWVDANGVTHMGHEVPEGYEGRPVRDIPLMIGD